MRRGCGLYTLGPKRKGPLKRVVAKLSGDHGSNLFGVDFVILECGHTSKSYGGQKAICQGCKNGLPKDDLNYLGYEDSTKIPIAEGYAKNFTAEEIKSRK